MQTAKTSSAVADDHVLLRNGLSNLIRSLETYAVLFEADSGKDFISQLKPTFLPDIELLEINTPDLDGFETALWLKQTYPEIKILAFSMYDNEASIIRMMKSGAKGYVLKDIGPVELRQVVDVLMRKGFYYSELITGKLIHTVNQPDKPGHLLKKLVSLNDREIEFLKQVCTEMTYKEIAEKMYLSPRTIDGYRDALFEKLNVKTRVGLVMYTIKNGIVRI